MDEMTDNCSESTDCIATCGDYRHFCPMYSEHVEGDIDDSEM